MAKTLAKIRPLALNAFQETLRKRVLYLVAVLTVLILIIIFSQLKFLQMARNAGETKTSASMTADFVQEALVMWDFSATFLALFLGAVGISSEIKAKTIVNVLSRPVKRSTYLTGRWLGTLMFLWAFQVVGILIALLIICVFDVRFAPVFWVGCVDMFVRSFFYSGVSLGLSVWMPPILAGCVSFFLVLLPVLVEDFLQHPLWILRTITNGVYYLAPARLPANLMSESFKKELLHPDYGLYLQVIGENFLYAIAFFLLACAAFSRRELRLR